MSLKKLVIFYSTNFEHVATIQKSLVESEIRKREVNLEPPLQSGRFMMVVYSAVIVYLLKIKQQVRNYRRDTSGRLSRNATGKR